MDKPPDFHLKFDLQAFKELDQLALLADQEYNYGNTGDWFGTFRGGLYGSYARIHGVIAHYHAVHSWMLKPRVPSETEYHLASIFFNMDSSLECITFALNALGFCAAKNSFRDVTDSKELRKISPYDLLGRKKEVNGYAEVFPNVQKLWKKSSGMLDTIIEQHDVSKHRSTIFVGGMGRDDPPPGFFESIGLGDNSSRRVLFMPMKEIILKSEPKKPLAERVSRPRKDHVLLEELVPQFQKLIEETGVMALNDAKCNIALKENKIKRH